MKNIKKFIAILFVTVLSMTTVAFASSISDITDKNVVDYTSSILEQKFIDCSIDVIEYMTIVEQGFTKEAYKEYLEYAKDDTKGNFVDFGDATVKRDNENGIVECSVIIKFEKKQVKGTVKSKFIEDSLYPVEVTFSSSFDDNKSFGDKMADAGKNTLIGMFTVVVILLLISAIISLFKFIPIIAAKLESKKNSKDANNVAVDNAIAQIEENEELTDDFELIAVISAAIAAAEGTSADGFVVRSIRKVNKNK